MSTRAYTFLYEFSLGTKVWRFAASPEDIVDPDGVVWEAAAISDDGVSTSGEATSDQLTIQCSSDLVPARIWMYSRPSKVMDITIRRALLPERVATGEDEGVADASGPRRIPVTNLRVRYSGEIAQCSFGQPGSAQFTCETLSATMQIEGLRLTWQRACPYVIYQCGVDKFAWRTVTTVTAINGNVVTVDNVGIGNYAGGILEYEHPIKGAETLTIESRNGLQLFIFDTAADLYVGQQVFIYPGCDQSPGSCESFGNTLNNGGIKDLPGESPFDGVNNPVF